MGRPGYGPLLDLAPPWVWGAALLAPASWRLHVRRGCRRFGYTAIAVWCFTFATGFILVLIGSESGATTAPVVYLTMAWVAATLAWMRWECHPRNAGSGVNDGIWLALIGAVGSAGFGGVVTAWLQRAKLKAETGATIDARWKAYADQLERRLAEVEEELSKASAHIEAQDHRMDGHVEADLDRAVKAKKS